MPVIPVFVSSTFRDFHSERGCLHSMVVPDLDEAVAPYGARVELLDLRWGVSTEELKHETEKQQQVLDVCLREIDRCHPLFVGLLGERFGWVPSAGRLIAALERAHVTPDPHSRSRPMSVTALEVWHGALSSSGDAIFALRNLSGDVPAAWRENPDAIGQLRREVQDAAAREPERVRSFNYTATVVDGRVAHDDLATFADRLLRALTPLVVARAQALAAAHISPYQAAVTILTESRRQVVVGRSGLIDRIVENIEASRALVLSGPSGVGKTTAWLAACDRLQAQGCTVAKVHVGAGPGSSSTRSVIDLLAGQLGWEMPITTNEAAAFPGQAADSTVSDDEVVAWWEGRLAEASRGTVIAIDGLDRMDPGRAREALDPLQTTPGGGAVFLVSTTLDSQVSVLRGRGLQPIEVTALPPEQAREAAREWARIDGAKQLPAQVAQVLGSKPRSGLWVRLAINEMNWLEQEHFNRAEAASSAGTRADAAIVSMLMDVARHLPDDDGELASRFLGHVDLVIGNPITTRTLLGSLALTRSGLTPADLQAITGLDALTLSRTRWLLGGQLSQLDATGRLAFDHSLIRQTALRQSAAGTDPCELHELLACHFASPTLWADHGQSGEMRMPDPVDAEEAIFHAVQSGDGQNLARALTLLIASGIQDWSGAIDALGHGILSADADGSEVARDTIGSLESDEYLADGAIGLLVLTTTGLRFRIPQVDWLLLLERVRHLHAERCKQYQQLAPQEQIPAALRLAELFALVAYVQSLEFREDLTEDEANSRLAHALSEAPRLAQDLQAFTTPGIRGMIDSMLLLAETSSQPFEALPFDLQVAAASREALETPDPVRLVECVRFAGERILLHSDDLSSSTPEQLEQFNALLVTVLTKITDRAYGSDFRYPIEWTDDELRVQLDFDPSGRGVRSVELSQFRADMWDLCRRWSAKAFASAEEVYLRSGHSSQCGAVLARTATAFIRARLSGQAALTDPIAVKPSDMQEAFTCGARLTAALQAGEALGSYAPLVQGHSEALWLLAAEGLPNTSNRSRPNPDGSFRTLRSWDQAGLVLLLELAGNLVAWASESTVGVEVWEDLQTSIFAAALDAEKSREELCAKDDFELACRFADLAVELFRLALAVSGNHSNGDDIADVQRMLRDSLRNRALTLYRKGDLPAALSDCTEAVALARAAAAGRVQDEATHRRLLDILEIRAMILEMGDTRRIRSRAEREAWSEVVAELELLRAMGWAHADEENGLLKARQKTHRW